MVAADTEDVAEALMRHLEAQEVHLEERTVKKTTSRTDDLTSHLLVHYSLACAPLFIY